MSSTTRILAFPDQTDYSTSRQPLPAFAADLRSGVETFERSHTAARRASEQFCRFTDIWPDQCERLEAALSGLIIAVQKLCNLFDDFAVLPQSVVSIRYQLIVALHHLKDQLQNIAVKVRALRPICRTDRRQTDKQRYEIQLKLPDLVKRSDQLHYEVHALLDRARFLEQTLLRETA